MATNLTHYRIFLASPSDVSEERILIETSINELNNTVCKTLNIYLDLLKWETHSYPSVGVNSQGVINKQISDYDFFIGIMWSKVGTPTLNYKSGTIEEFNIAYERYKNKEEIKILFYFSKKPISPNEIDPDQLKELKIFKNSLGEKGVYYYEYSSPDEFQSSVKFHISSHLNEIQNKNKKKNNETYSKPFNERGTLEPEVQNYDELGLIEYIETSKECFSDAEGALERLGNFLSDLGTNIAKRTDKIDSLNAFPFSTLKEKKKEIDKASNDMFDYIKRTNVEIPIFHDNYYKGMEALSNGLTIQEEDGIISYSDLNIISKTLKNNDNIFNNTINQIEGFRIQVSKLPRISASIKKAKIKMDQTLEELLLELKSSQNLSKEFTKRLDNIIDNNNFF